MGPHVDGGVTIFQNDYKKVAEQLVSEYGLDISNVFEEQSNDSKIFEIVCNSDISLNTEGLKTAVKSFRRACASFIKIYPSGLFMLGSAEREGYIFSDNANYRARIAFSATSGHDIIGPDDFGRHHRLEKKTSLFLGKGIEEVIYAPRRIGAKKQSLVTQPRFTVTG